MKKAEYPTREEIDKFKMLFEFLSSSYKEMKEFSKKKPDELLNKFKVSNINGILKEVKKLQAKEPTDIFLKLLDTEALPSYSDAILVIGQFTAAMDRYRSKYSYTEQFSDIVQWRTKD